jgi:Probable transposase
LAVGVDRGVAVAIATSDGELIDRQFLTATEQRRALRLQRRLARAARHGRNRDKTRAALVGIRARERRRRQDFCAQAAHRLAITNAVVVIEALKTKQMTRDINVIRSTSHLTLTAADKLTRHGCLCSLDFQCISLPGPVLRPSSSHSAGHSAVVAAVGVNALVSRLRDR